MQYVTCKISYYYQCGTKQYIKIIVLI